MKSLLKSTVGLGAITSLFCLGLPSAPVLANSFNACARDLIASGISGEAAGSACGSALVPRDLSLCVSRVNRPGAIAPEEALQACYQVRRPRDLASCFNSIERRVDLSSTTPNQVLDNCRKSLLPERYSECVLGLTNQGESIAAEQALNDCLSTENYPTALFPTTDN
ncbi:hypothetical protein [Gloeocapsa sp. PCC 73106]|uniref:hypothetical protein n=1 Tax=Gloeocapsa sp. PCC 73106 TaxID=102232 RepID=UPI0002ACE5F3|nr:hypothetical protein [Gloeocapsa sp. PCC 73106]ELR96576.1 hypothetical protein GLO73106DRAFT_00003710 [Gloeocapsa sp. PCC 73106]